MSEFHTFYFCIPNLVFCSQFQSMIDCTKNEAGQIYQIRTFVCQMSELLKLGMGQNCFPSTHAMGMRLASF